MAQQILPLTHRALIVSSTSSFPTLQTAPTPTPGPGSAIVRILAANVTSYMRDIYNGARQYPFPMPLIPGTSAIGRIAAVGPDATLLKPGMLVLVDRTIRGRDDATAVSLSGIHEGYTEGKYVANWGEIADLAYIATLLVPYGGLKDIDLRAGETVIVSPATGAFGGAAVLVALAMGARVIAMGRNMETLEKIKKRSERIERVIPPEAGKSTHIKSGILALKHSGRVSLMGGIEDDVPIPHSVFVHWNLTLKGKWMLEWEDIKSMIKMAENGVLKLGESAGLRVVGKFGLEEWDKAFTAAEKNAVMGETALITP